jgi:hypothetical protein
MHTIGAASRHICVRLWSMQHICADVLFAGPFTALPPTGVAYVDDRPDRPQQAGHAAGGRLLYIDLDHDHNHIIAAAS